MDFILELIAEILLDGSMEVFTDKKLPMALRIIAGIILATVYGGLALVGVMLTVSGIKDADGPLILCGSVLIVFTAVFGIMLYRKIHKHR